MNAPDEGNEVPVLLLGRANASMDDCACSAPVLAVSEGDPGTENDCACSTQPAGAGAAQACGGLYRLAEGLRFEPMPGAFQMALAPSSPQGPALVNPAARKALLAFEEARPLATSLDKRMAAAGLVEPLPPTAPTAPREPVELTAWLHVTNACNLSCPYCYVRKSSAEMTLETGTRAVRSLFDTAQQRGMRRVRIKYAGGEATLHEDLVRALHDIAAEEAARRGVGLSEVLLSNGVCLDGDWAGWLGDSAVQLMLSLDGAGADHDLLRGAGSFARLEYAVDQLLLPRSIRPFISVTISAANAASAIGAARWALDRGLPLSLNFYRRPAQAASDLAAQDAALISGMQAIYRLVEERLPEQPFFNGLLDRARLGAHERACSVGQGYVVITHEGRVAQCHMRLDDAGGEGLDGDLVEATRRGALQNPAVDEKLGCRACFFRYTCAGGCPLETYRALGRYDAPSPYCAVYRALLPQALRLEGLRLMKQGGYLKPA